MALPQLSLAWSPRSGTLSPVAPKPAALGRPSQREPPALQVGVRQAPCTEKGKVQKPEGGTIGNSGLDSDPNRAVPVFPHL